MMRRSFSAARNPKSVLCHKNFVWQSYEDQCSLVGAPRDEDNLVPIP